METQKQDEKLKELEKEESDEEKEDVTANPTADGEKVVLKFIELECKNPFAEKEEKEKEEDNNRC